MRKTSAIVITSMRTMVISTILTTENQLFLLILMV